MLFYNEGDTTACCIYLYKELLKMQKEKNIFMPSIMKRNNTFSTLLNKLIKRMDLILENNKIIITLPVEKNAPIPRKTKQLLNRQKSHAKLSASFFEARDSSHPSLHTKARHKNEFKIG